MKVKFACISIALPLISCAYGFTCPKCENYLTKDWYSTKFVIRNYSPEASRIITSRTFFIKNFENDGIEFFYKKIFSISDENSIINFRCTVYHIP